MMRITVESATMITALHHPDFLILIVIEAFLSEVFFS